MEEIDLNYIDKIGKKIWSKIRIFFVWLFFSVRITTSVYPVPAICQFDQLGDWFEPLADILHWNLRKTQSSFDPDLDIQDDEELKSEDEDNTFNENKDLSTNSIPNSSSETRLWLILSTGKKYWVFYISKQNIPNDVNKFSVNFLIPFLALL